MVFAAVGLLALLAASSRPDHAGRRGERLVWGDDFAGPAGASPSAARWRPELGGHGWGNAELQQYTGRPANAALDGQGHLVITARAERYRGPDRILRHLTSARLDTRGRFAVRYGRVEARMRIPAGRGLLPAFWAVGTDLDSAGWPAAGEVDVVEVLGSRPRTAVGSLHGPAANGDDYALSLPRRSRAPLSERFHTYGMRWSPGRIEFTLDGRVYATRTPGRLPLGARWVFDKPMFLVLSLAVGGTWPGPPDSSTPLPARLIVDYVRVWRPRRGGG